MAVDCIELDVYHYLILVLLRKLLIRVSLQGRMVEIFGKEASGKTTLALHIVKEAQKNGGLSFIYDALFFLPLLRLVRILLKKNPNRKYFSIFDFHTRGLPSMVGDLFINTIYIISLLPDFMILLYKY